MSLYQFTSRIIVLFLFISYSSDFIYAQDRQSKTRLDGVVYEKGTQKPLEGVSIVFPQYDIWAVTKQDGTFSIENCPEGKTKIVLQGLGLITLEEDYVVKTGSKASFYVEQSSLRLKDVEVTAREKKEGATPITTISRAAMDHIQATSLSDVLSLLPGAVPTNQSLSSVNTAMLHDYYDGKVKSGTSVTNANAMNSMGTSIILDNAPLSNNSNLQVFNTATAGNVTGFQSAAGTGVDLRQISADNIESVDIIKGIASVQYGDASSGAIIVRSKAGKSPMQLRFKINPNITQTSLATGLALGEKKGALNISLDYAHSVNDERSALDSYNRYNAKFLYSNSFFEKLKTNFSLELLYTKDNTKLDEDDKNYAAKKNSDNKGFRFNANGSYLVNGDWLKTIQYTLSSSYTKRDSYSQRVVSAAENIYSTAMSDGSIVSAHPGEVLTDINGNPLTNWLGDDQSAFAYSTQNAYIGAYNVDGKEWSNFASLKATFYRETGIAKHRFFIGGDYRSDGNNGNGKTFDLYTRPSTSNSRTIRERSYKDVPFLQTGGAYIEENLTLDLGGHDFEAQMGVRYDKQKELKSEITPRINASLEVVPKIFYIRGGYGEIIKSAPLLYLYPEKAYFDILNYTNKATESDPAKYQYLMTTRAFDTTNESLELAKNKKKEIGIDLYIGNKSLSITAYHEHMKNGYGYFENYTTTRYDQYVNTISGLELSNSRHVFLSYNKPGNTLNIETKAVDVDLNLGRFDAIRTAFVLNGGYVNTTSYNNDELLYLQNGNINSKYVGIYEKGSEKLRRERLATTLRVVHNIPQLGFVVSVSAVTTWLNTAKNILGNDSIPVAYMEMMDDGSVDVKSFDPARAGDSEFGSIVRTKTLNKSRYEKESLPVLWCFNINLTKEIGKNMSVSFFANNLFSYQPRYLKKRFDTYETLNPPIFFGIELSAKIPW